MDGGIRQAGGVTCDMALIGRPAGGGGGQGVEQGVSRGKHRMQQGGSSKGVRAAGREQRGQGVEQGCRSAGGGSGGLQSYAYPTWQQLLSSWLPKPRSYACPTCQISMHIPALLSGKMPMHSPPGSNECPL